MAIDSLAVSPTGIDIGFGSGSMSAGRISRHQAQQVLHNLDYDRQKFTAMVNGARDAGLHPLFALGGAGAGSSPATWNIPGQSATGSHADIGVQVLSKAAKEQAKAVTKNQELRNQLLQIEIDQLKKGPAGNNDIDLDKAVAETFKVKPEEKVVTTPLTEQVPSQSIPGKSDKEPELQAGHTALWKNYQVAPGLKIQVPGEDFQEVMENPIMWYPTYQKNREAIHAYVKTLAKKGKFLTGPQKQLVDFFKALMSMRGDPSKIGPSP